MLTINSMKPLFNGAEKKIIEGECLSGDPKPLCYANGSKLLEMDTSTLYVFDEANKLWRAWS